MIGNNKNLVLSNQLVKGRYQLSKEEQNFIYLMISQIEKDDTEFKEYQIHIKDLENAELTQKQYGRYREFAKSLMSKVVTIENEKSILTANWFADIEYIKNTGYIRATISQKLKPYLLQLKQEFVQAKLPTLLQFKSKYSSRLYLLLKSDFDRQSKHRKNLFVIYDLEDLHNRFELPKSYKSIYKNFKEKFLLNALEEINEKTDLDIQYKELKTGRKITSIEFCISKKQQSEEQLIQEIVSTQTKSDFIPLNASKCVINVLLDDELGLTKTDIKKIFEHYKLEDIEQICLDLSNSWDSSKLISKIGFLRGKLKQLNRKKTENHSILFDEI
ncbi:replication initiation protein [Francisella philomiragia]|uniref:replication initiation protein n=1 Tax=Francisella philomiragia TaxID=28110 RepID=UPI003518D927